MTLDSATGGPVLMKQLDNRRQNPLGHTPQHPDVQMVADSANRGAVALILDRSKDIGMQQCIELHPPGSCHLMVEYQGGGGRQREDKRTHDDRWQHRSSRREIVEHRGNRNAAELDADLFAGFPAGGRGQVRVARAPPATGKGNLTGPSVTLPLGATNQEHAVGIGNEDDRDGGLGTIGKIFFAGIPFREPGEEPGDTAQWECP